jgi:hypothetical protein
MIPVSTEVLFSLYGSHNLATWPAPFVGYALCILALILTIRPSAARGRIIAAILAVFWLWAGAVFQIGFFAPLNWGALIFGASFILEGLLLLWLGVLRNRLDFRLGSGCLLFAFALAFPALDFASGHPWPQMQLPGTLPAPTVLVTLAFLMMAHGIGVRRLAVIPLLWALTGGAAAAFLGIWQDMAMAAVSLAAVILIFLRR